MRKLRLSVVSFQLSVLVCFGAAAWTPELSMKVKTVADVTPSPDGRWVVYSEARSVIEAEKSEVVTHIFVAKADGSDRYQPDAWREECHRAAILA